MVVFEWDTDSVDGAVIFYIGSTSCTGEDEENANEIYQQLDAQASGLTDY